MQSGRETEPSFCPFMTLMRHGAHWLAKAGLEVGNGRVVARQQPVSVDELFADAVEVSNGSNA
jgi:hypothetical protein